MKRAREDGREIRRVWIFLGVKGRGIPGPEVCLFVCVAVGCDAM